MKKIKRIKFNYRHYIAILITLIFIACSVFVYNNVFERTKETFVDIFSSIKYYFMSLLYPDIKNSVSVVNISKVKFEYVFPINFETYKLKLSAWFKALWSQENFSEYILSSTTTFLILYVVIIVLILSFLLFKLLINSSLKTCNNDFNQDTKPLKAYKKIERFLFPIKKFAIQFYDFCSHSFYWKLWLVIWLYNLNVFTILGETIAYLFYFVSSFDLSSIYIQFYKLFFDLAIMFSTFPGYIWFFVIWFSIIKIRKKIAFRRLNHMEAFNTGFVKSLPTVNVIYGLMGGGKGQIMTDMVLTNAKIFRSDCKETMRKYDFMFPYFPWPIFENALKRQIKKHKIYGLATCEQYISKRKRLFYNALSLQTIDYNILKCYLYGYDFANLGLTYDNKLYIVDIFTALEDYAKAYFIYTTIELNVSNYAIRSDGILEDFGNFPLWDYDFFNRKSSEIDKISTYGKILDQDILRRGKKVDPNNPYADTLEFGIVVMTELDKERGNQFVTNEMKMKAEETNQKNDLFNYGLKLDRHSSTVDFKHYMKIFFDLQRLGSTNSDLQECGQHLGVGEKDKKILAMPMFFIEEFLYGLIDDKFNAFYDEYRFYHGNNTLYMYLIKKYCAKFINFYRNTYNMFGYDKHHLIMEDVSTSSFSKHPYYLIYKKSHALRYYTDSLVDYFRQTALNKKVGMIDYPSYSGVKATKEEFSKQNSYFYMNLENVFSNEKE